MKSKPLNALLGFVVESDGYRKMMAFSRAAHQDGSKGASGDGGAT